MIVLSLVLLVTMCLPFFAAVLEYKPVADGYTIQSLDAPAPMLEDHLFIFETPVVPTDKADTTQHLSDGTTGFIVVALLLVAAYSVRDWPALARAHSSHTAVSRRMKPS